MDIKRAKAKKTLFSINNLTETLITFNQGKIIEFTERENDILVNGKEVSFPMKKEEFEKYFTVL